MKIIEYGDIKPGQIKCKYCNAELEYTEEDIKSSVTKDIVFVYVECPICKMATNIYSKSISNLNVKVIK